MIGGHEHNRLARPHAGRGAQAVRGPSPAHGAGMALWLQRFAEGTPARAYLTGRLAWPIDGPDLPGSVRWIAADALSDVLCWPAEAMPGGEWAGAVAFQYGGPGKVPAWKLEALTAHDQRSDQAGSGGRWRRNAGSFEGLQFETTDHGSGQLHVCEGEVTALARGGSRRGRWCASSGKRGGRSKRTACMHSMMTGLTQRMCSPLKSGGGGEGPPPPPLPVWYSYFTRTGSISGTKCCPE